MYFAFDPPSQIAACLIADELAKVRSTNSQNQIQVYAIIDGAFDEQFFTSRWRTSSVRLSLYKNTQLCGLDSASPHLVRGPTEQSEQLTWLSKLLIACGSAPMWSVVATSYNIEELAEHFRPFLIAKTDDNLEWPLRLGDARVLPQIIGALPPEHLEDLFRPLYLWSTNSRDGVPMFWTGNGDAKFPDREFDKLRLSDSAFVKLVEKAEADAILAKIHEVQPELLRSRLPSECHRIVERQLTMANQSNMQGIRERIHFSSLALLLRDGFLSSPEITTLLANVRRGAKYEAELTTLADEFWNMHLLSE